MKRRITLVTAIVLALATAVIFAWPAKRAGTRVAPYRFRVVPPSDPSAEIAFLEERVRQRPTEGLDLAHLAALYLKQKRWADAEAAARKSLENLSVGNEGAKLVLAELAEVRHRFEEALRIADEVLKEKPGCAGALSIRVTSNLALGRVQDAGRAADELVDRFPGTGSWSLRALVMEAQGREGEAILDFEAALAAEEIGQVEGSAWTRTMLGRLHLRRGRLEFARDCFEEALRILPGDPLALGLLAKTEARQGRLDIAEIHYRDAIKLSGEPPFMMELAKLKREQGDASAAETLFAEAEAIVRREIQETPFGHRCELARILLERGRPGDVAEAVSLAWADAQVRRDPMTLDTYAWALSRAGRWTEARQAIREALRTGVQDPELFLRAGAIEVALGQKARANLYFEKARGV